jgi:hypothetical protein
LEEDMPALNILDIGRLGAGSASVVWAMALGLAGVPPGAASFGTIMAALLLAAAALGRLNPLAWIGRRQQRSEAAVSLAVLLVATWTFVGITASVASSTDVVSLDCYSFDGSIYPGC